MSSLVLASLALTGCAGGSLEPQPGEPLAASAVAPAPAAAAVAPTSARAAAAAPTAAPEAIAASAPAASSVTDEAALESTEQESVSDEAAAEAGVIVPMDPGCECAGKSGKTQTPECGCSYNPWTQAFDISNMKFRCDGCHWVQVQGCHVTHPRLWC